MIASQSISVFSAGIPAAPVRMQNQTVTFSEAADSVLKSRNAELSLFMFSHGKADDGSVRAIQNGSQIQLPVFALYLRHIGKPFGVGGGCLEITPNQIFAELIGRIPLGDAVRISSALKQTVFPAQPAAFPVTGPYAGRQFFPQTADAVI